MVYKSYYSPEFCELFIAKESSDMVGMFRAIGYRGFIDASIKIGIENANDLERRKNLFYLYQQYRDVLFSAHTLKTDDPAYAVRSVVDDIEEFLANYMKFGFSTQFLIEPACAVFCKLGAPK